MKIREIVQTTPNFQVLSEDEIERIYFDALGIIESDGARVYSQPALDLLKDSDALVTDTDLVRIPTRLVETALRWHPRKLTVSGRNGERSVRLQKDELAFGAGPIYPLAPFDKEDLSGKSAYEAVYDTARLVDNLSNYDFITGPLLRSGQDDAGFSPDKVVAMMDGCKKPLLLGSRDREELSLLWQMATLVCGGEKEFCLSPLFAHYVQIDTPLTLSAVEAEKLLFCAEKGIPCVCASHAIAGITAPSTIAGMLVVTLAETMLASVISYLKKPGMPLIRGGLTTIPQPCEDLACYSAPELPLSEAANTDVSKWLGLGMLFPGGITNDQQVGQMAGTDCTTTLYYGFLSGADMIYGSGLVDSGRSASMDSMVMCNEIIDMIKQIGKGISTEPEYLALELIESVGPGGEYLTQDHTFEHWQEWFLPRLIDRTLYDSWEAAGKKTLRDRALEKRRQILDEHVPEEMDPKLIEELRSLAASQG
ncbi:MAG: trimethylamine methyltransferase family protein [Desulfosalsimonadaceae bacterium]